MAETRRVSGAQLLDDPLLPVEALQGRGVDLDELRNELLARLRAGASPLLQRTASTVFEAIGPGPAKEGLLALWKDVSLPRPTRARAASILLDADGADAYADVFEELPPEDGLLGAEAVVSDQLLRLVFDPSDPASVVRLLEQLPEKLCEDAAALFEPLRVAAGLPASVAWDALPGRPALAPFHRVAADALAAEGSDEALLLLRRARDEAPDEASRALFAEAARRARAAGPAPGARQWDAFCSNAIGGGLMQVFLRQQVGAVFHIANVTVDLPNRLRAALVLPGASATEAAAVMGRFCGTGAFEFAPLPLAEALRFVDDAAAAALQANARLPAMTLGALRFAARAPRGPLPEPPAPAPEAPLPALRALLRSPPYTTWCFEADDGATVADVVAAAAFDARAPATLASMARLMAAWHRARGEAQESALLARAALDTAADFAAAPLVRAVAERSLE